MTTEVDHLVVVADSLAQGVAWCEQTLGATPGPGGRHALMGTHNRLLSLANDAYPGSYLEIITIDPEAPPPARARWFGMDHPALQAAVRETPRLVHLVARCRPIEPLRDALFALGTDPGPPIAAERDTPQGRLTWRLLVREDGAIACNGALPTLIEWGARHPADDMPPSGVTLGAVTLGGLPAPVHRLLRLRGVAAADLPGLSVRLHTPRGPLTLTSPP
ncbi:MAG: VOC family protein [Burkholderiales bacterium]|nr:VOC family protein [Burkholderiales bacterium]